MMSQQQCRIQMLSSCGCFTAPHAMPDCFQVVTRHRGGMLPVDEQARWHPALHSPRTAPAHWAALRWPATTLSSPCLTHGHDK